VIKVISIAAVGTAIALYGVLEWSAASHVSQAGFWFEHVTFDLPHLERSRFGGPLTEGERQRIQETALSELREAFEGMRVEFSGDRDAFYRVRVVQEFGSPFRGAAGASRVVAPIGGNGAVNFLMLGSQAVTHAPADADRAAVVEAIGRGIGRAAVHEFLHQMLPRVNIHDTRDAGSYEYPFSSRPAQFYGPMRWDIARQPLVERFGNVQKHQDAREFRAAGQ
jgi:hypothetical protein